MTVLSYAARNNQAGTCVCTSEGVIVLLWSKLPGMVVMIIDENRNWPDYAVAQPHAGLPLPVPGLLTAQQKRRDSRSLTGSLQNSPKIFDTKMLLHNCHCRYDDGQMDMKIRVACKMAYESLRVWRTNR
ncbi:hypothetical protein E3O66_15820 [Salmonella enterica subsp. enterica serovar Oslo]|nr:hypothetical protein [Salmonella enterica subsp. enterica serovar Oslo]ECG6796574.1 hypothetical protein [Salmonella enterica subsp. enterica serovar Oslo]EGM7048186.1 hypothetical protein [Salmonella enterica subsp. enterica serovar Oslo]